MTKAPNLVASNQQPMVRKAVRYKETENRFCEKEQRARGMPCVHRAREANVLRDAAIGSNTYGTRTRVDAEQEAAQ